MNAGTNGAAPVVLVDDDRSARVLTQHYFDKLLLRNPVCTAADGDEAVELLERLHPAPALILLDLHMPKRPGLDVLAWIRSQPRLAEVPVVVLTGSSEMDEIDAAYEFGIASYLVKPVGFAALTDVVRGLRVPWMLASGEQDY